MSIITKPSTISKGEVASIQLNKSELASVASVAADEYYSDQLNWSKVILNYKSEEINQFHVVTFDATQSSPSSSFLASEKAWDIFQILSIDIIDFDNGFFRIDASELVASEFEIDMGSAPSTGIPFQLFDNFQSYNPLTDPTFLERSVEGFGAPTSRALHNVSLGSVVNGVANYDVTFNLSNITSNEGYGIYIGIIGSSDAPNIVSLADVSSNYESYAVAANVSAGTTMGVVTPFQGGYNSVIIPAGAAKSIRFKQTGTSLEYYINGSLVYTQTVDSSKNVPYLYPYILSNWSATVDSVTKVDMKNYVIWDNISGGAATDINGKLYKGSNGIQPQGVSNTSIGTFDGTYSLTFVMTDVNSYGIFAGLSANPLGTSGSWVTLLGGSLGFRDSNGADTAIGSYSTSGDITIKLTYTSQTIQIFLNNVEVLAPTALFQGFLPSQQMYPFAIVSPYAGSSTNVNTGLDIIKEASYSN